MITIITGAPGAGKTAAAVSLIEDLAKDRPVYVSGIPDLLIPHVELEDPRRWMELVEDGAIVVIDEVQRIWRPAGSGARVPPDIEALETHRHRDIHFFLITQQTGLVHSNVRALCGRYIHLRDVGALGRWWYEWPEVPNGPVNYKSALVRKRYKLNKAIFAKYKSASGHSKPIRSTPMVLIALPVLLIALAYGGWMVYRTIVARVAPALPGAVAASAPGAASSAPGRAVGGGGAASAPLALAVAVAPGGPPDRPFSPPDVGGCWMTEEECVCVTRAAPVRRLTDLGKLCVRIVRGEVLPHPSWPAPKPYVDERRQGGALGVAPAASAVGASI